jgi:hypothetical protein
MPYFIVEAYADDCKVTAMHWSAKRAFADAVAWSIVRGLSDVAIGDGLKAASSPNLRQPLHSKRFLERRECREHLFGYVDCS